MVRRKTIRISSYKTRVKDLSSLRADVFNSIGDQLYHINDWQTLNYTFLSQIDPYRRWIKNEKKSIDKAMQGLVTKFFRGVKKVTIKDLTTNKITVESKPNKEFEETFNQHILSLDTLPSQTYSQLNETVIRDLSDVIELIKFYETDPFIKRFISQQSTSGDHEDLTKLDFYLRCVGEQKIILDYFINGMKKRAITKAGYFPHHFKSIFRYTDQFRDYPYTYRRSPEYFDHRKISESTHRVLEFYVDESFEMEELYKSNKVLFYKKAFKLKSPEQIFKNIDFNLGQLPLKNDRKVIFTELQRLFKAKRWIAFFALALPQVEGIFTEMLDAINPNKKSKSLSDKVQKVRPYYSLSSHYFDYYQYTLPKLRNSFMHTGYHDDFQTKSFDLLTDIEHLLRVFTELENPLVKIRKIHVKKDPMDFVSFREYGEYFHLLKSLEQKQKLDLKKDISEFEKDFLISYCDAEFICHEVVQGLPEFCKDFTAKIEYAIDSAEFADSLSRHIKDRKSYFTDFSKIEKLESFFLINRQETEEIEAYANFISGYETYLPSIHKDITDGLNTTKKNHGKFVENVLQLKNFLASQEQEGDTKTFTSGINL